MGGCLNAIAFYLEKNMIDYEKYEVRTQRFTAIAKQSVFEMRDGWETQLNPPITRVIDYEASYNETLSRRNAIAVFSEKLVSMG